MPAVNHLSDGGSSMGAAVYIVTTPSGHHGALPVKSEHQDLIFAHVLSSPLQAINGPIQNTCTMPDDERLLGLYGYEPTTQAIAV